MKIDLHMHSLYSVDGELSPEELVKKCVDCGISVMAVADHDNVRGVAQAKKAAKEQGICCISAAEMDCSYKGINFHVVGYGIDETSPVFDQIGQDILDQERSNSERKLVLTNQLGFDLKREQLDELSGDGFYTGEIFAEVLLNDPRYMDHDLLKPYREGGARSDNPYVNFYWDFYAQGKPCYTEVKYLPLEEMIQVICGNGGVAVLAHPGNNLKGRFELFDEMVQAGIQGVEAFSSYHTPETSEYFLKKGREYGLLITCGSDFHGKTKPSIQLGETGCTIHTREMWKQLEEFQLI